MLVAALAITHAASRLAAQSVDGVDTIRVGSVQLRTIAQAGGDTLDVTFEVRMPSGEVQRTQSVGFVPRWSKELLEGDSVLHARFGQPTDRSRYDFYLDPHTLATKRFEQHTPIDSAVATATGSCVSGWVHLQNAPRREIACDRATDRFGGSPLDDYLVALVPLKAGLSAVVATYGPIGGSAGYAFRVVGSESLTLSDREFATWKVERKVVSQYGTYATTLWVDQSAPRILKTTRDFGNGRTSLSVLRHP
jgi:hypothetical protein